MRVVVDVIIVLDDAIFPRLAQRFTTSRHCSGSDAGPARNDWLLTRIVSGALPIGWLNCPTTKAAVLAGRVRRPLAFAIC